MAKKKRPTAEKAENTGKVYQFKITLQGSSPLVWRQFDVPDDVSLAELHEVIQIVMGWEDAHLHQFATKTERYAPRSPYDDSGFDDESIDEGTVKIKEVVGRKGARLQYEYDLGDGWEHLLQLEEVKQPEPKVTYPVCLKGKGACPPEDCGGVWGYEHLLEVIADPEHEEHEELLEWLGEDFDAEEFDLEGVNSVLKSLR